MRCAMQSSPEETNDSLYKALLSHKQQANSRQQSIAGSIKSLNEANAMRRTQAEDAPSVVTASTHYQSNARYTVFRQKVCATWGLNPESLAHKTNALTDYASGAIET